MDILEAKQLWIIAEIFTEFGPETDQVATLYVSSIAASAVQWCYVTGHSSIIHYIRCPKSRGQSKGRIQGRTGRGSRSGRGADPWADPEADWGRILGGRAGCRQRRHWYWCLLSLVAPSSLVATNSPKRPAVAWFRRWGCGGQVMNETDPPDSLLTIKSQNHQATKPPNHQTTKPLNQARY